MGGHRPDGADKRAGEELEDEEELARAKAYFRSWRNGDGTTGFRGKLPDAQADMLLKALAAFSSPRRRKNPHIRTHQPDDNHPADHPGDRGDDAGADGRPPQDAAPDGGPPQDAPPDGPAAEDPPPEAEPDRTGGSRSFDHDHDTDVSPEERETGRTIPYPVRLGHALMELLGRLPADLLPATGGVSATVVATMTVDQLTSGLGVATLDTGTEISAAQLRRLACDAGIIPAVLDGEGQPLDIGREQRLYTKAQRVAMNVRDQGCRGEGRDRPAAWTVAHHLTPWSQGGRTRVDDGAMLCDYHHQLIHSTRWTATVLRSGKIRFRRTTRTR